jgi:DNA-binding transcriptional LysR family regulator
MRRLQADALALHGGLERRLTLAVVPELIAGRWSAPLAVLAREFPSLEVEVLSAPQADALRLLHDGAVQLALVFERERLDDREAFQEVGSELLVAVLAPGHPLLDAGGPRLEDLIDARQIVVAGRDGAAGANDVQRDPRFVHARDVWRVDSHLATLNLVQAGLGWAYLPRALVQPLVAAGSLVEIPFDNISNQLRLWVDVVWSRERPLGVGARRYVDLMRAGWRPAGDVS